jgi:hypothetical protein
MATATVAALAGVSSLAAYLNAKYHIAQDLRVYRRRKRALQYYAELSMFVSDTRFHVLTPNSPAESVMSMVLIRPTCVKVPRSTMHLVKRKTVYLGRNACSRSTMGPVLLRARRKTWRNGSYVSHELGRLSGYLVGAMVHRLCSCDAEL